MRGVAALIAYLLGLGAIISFGIAGLMALQSPPQPTPSGPVATAPPTERVAKPSAKGCPVQIREAQNGEHDSQAKGRSTDYFSIGS
jgi:hypothetical protein